MSQQRNGSNSTISLFGALSFPEIGQIMTFSPESEAPQRVGRMTGGERLFGMAYELYLGLPNCELRFLSLNCNLLMLWRVLCGSASLLSYDKTCKVTCIGKLSCEIPQRDIQNPQCFLLLWKYSSPKSSICKHWGPMFTNSGTISAISKWSWYSNLHTASASLGAVDLIVRTSSLSPALLLSTKCFFHKR